MNTMCVAVAGMAVLVMLAGAVLHWSMKKAEGLRWRDLQAQFRKDWAEMGAIYAIVVLVFAMLARVGIGGGMVIGGGTAVTVAAKGCSVVDIVELLEWVWKKFCTAAPGAPTCSAIGPR